MLAAIKRSKVVDVDASSALAGAAETAKPAEATAAAVPATNERRETDAFFIVHAPLHEGLSASARLGHDDTTQCSMTWSTCADKSPRRGITNRHSRSYMVSPNGGLLGAS